MELQKIMNDRKSKHFLACLKELDFVVMKEKLRKVTAKKAKDLSSPISGPVRIGKWTQII